MSSSHVFQLKPHHRSSQIPAVRGVITEHHSLINFQLTVEGNINTIHWPVQRPERVQGLWHDTCFEFFLGPISQPRYFEANLSPSGAWNSFAFSDVRTDMTETDLLQLESWQSSYTENEANFSAAFRHHLEPDIYQLGISTILNERPDVLRYFALQHSGEVPDFHDRRNWLIQLPITTQT